MAVLRGRSAYTVRRDSVLARRYILGELDPSEWPVDKVVRKLLDAMFAYDHTRYRERCVGAYRAMANYLKSSFPDVSWQQIWEAVRKHGPEIVRPLAMYEAGYLDGTPPLSYLGLNEA